MSSSKATLTKKACDGCKVRKVRCGGGNPCRPCLNARIQCSYNRVQQTRGPQKLRAATRHLIERTQQNEHHHHATSSEHTERKATERLPTNAIASLLYIYHVRMYPVWPIVHVDNLIAALQRDTDGHDNETRALATAVAAATMAQLRLDKACVSDRSITADALAGECLEARRSFDYRSKANLNTIRTAFFLHVYYENQQPGGSQSILYLREAITLAQMMYLHREASYAGLPPEEQQDRRRVLWLLFVTERGVCILHKLPVVLKTDTAMPEIDANDEPQVLPAFLKLLALFKIFEQTRMFDIVEDSHLGLNPPLESPGTSDPTFHDILQDRFRDGPGALGRVSDVQRADLCVTRHWMRILTWKALSHQSMRGSHAPPLHLSPSFPLTVARDLVNAVSRLPRTALLAHGLGMQLKLHEIANSLADAVTNMATLPEAPTWDQESRPSSILARLHSILSAFKDGGNNTLVELLYQKMAHAHSVSSSTIYPPLGGVRSTDKRRRETESASRDSASSSGVWEIGPSGMSSWADEEVILPNPADSQDSTSESINSSEQPLDPVESIVQPSFSDQPLGYPWSYVQSGYDPLAYSSLQQFGTSTGLLTAPEISNSLELGSVDTVLNHLIFNSPSEQLSLATYLTTATPSEDNQFARIGTLT
ncbi:fungal-specific transcription factor domain-containing protein [Aspergillus karnatakaensis]|uniref:Zn(II)2Cys6 transcription factor n=1 Tax=Aspergillus karnatakaensis TaxID=1810916 RepID=UPI003CCD7FDB